MSRALYEDLFLTPEQIARVCSYIRQVDFHLPGATSADFAINQHARYLGYMFQQEDLESYGVGLECTAPGMEYQRTFIRMSRGQLLGHEDAPILPVNDPVLAADAMTLHRFYDKECRPLRHGEETYSSDAGAPGADMDLSMVEQQLRDIVAFHNGEPVPGNQEILDLRVYWGTLLAGRYPRLKHLEKSGRLSAPQADRLRAVEADINSVEGILHSLGLATLEDLNKPKREDG
ncbi:hypothetical protein [Corynebacterium singulare]|uniref:hypothetical protein n=1 Tax=Corynebacterium singulare TaxID=161899 RepID=UPI0011AA676B|nr:hypothetical protein [Corynebacterium singulare]